MANTFATPASSSTVMIARIDWNNSIESLLTCFYGDARPTVFNFNIEGTTPSIVPDGTLYRSSRLGTLLIKDDLNHQSNPFYGGNFTRNGIGYIVEENITALTANIANRERGEIIITPSPNTRMYIKSTTEGSNFVDIGIPFTDSIVTNMIANNAVTTDKIGPNVATLTQTQVFSDQQTIINSGVTSNVPLIVTSETGNVIIGLNANGNSATGISHNRDSNGIQVVGSDGISLVEIDMSALLINGISASTGVGGIKSIRIFTSNDTWNRPANITRIAIFGVGGGGGGGSSRSTTTSNAAGGGGGGYAWRLLDVTSIPSANVVIGTGGTVSSQANGGTGGTTSFDSWIICTGGQGGSRDGNGGTGGIGSGGNTNLNGQSGDGGGSVFTGVGTIAGTGRGGNSMLGFGGASRFRNRSGENGKLFGGGGGGPYAPNNPILGGVGASGIIVVMEFTA